MFVGILFGPVALFFFMLQMIAIISSSTVESKTREFWSGSCKKSLKDLLPSYFLSLSIELAIVEKLELKFSAMSFEFVVVLSLLAKHLGDEQFFDLRFIISLIPCHTFLSFYYFLERIWYNRAFLNHWWLFAIYFLEFCILNINHFYVKD